MMETPRLTFVLPCYNVERYLQDCLDSIFACPLPDDEYEVLCIDDCSPDGSLSILKRNADEHANLRIVSHEKNMGLGGARNTGIREARGKYLWFIDSDDYINPSSLKEMMMQCEQNRLDVMAFNYREVNEKCELIRDASVFPFQEVCDGYAFANNVFGDDFANHAGYVYRFIYRVDYLREANLYFPEHVCWEDTVYMPKSILSAQRIQSVPDICYNYRRNSASISGQYHRQYKAELICQMAFCAGKDLLAYSGEINDQMLSDSFKNKAVSMINGFWIHLLRASGRERRRFYQQVDEYHPDLLRPIMNNRSRLLLSPYIGRILAGTMSLAYGMKHNRN